MANVIYPGTFDPFTNGHLDIVKRAAKLFESVLIAVGDNPGKKTLLTRDERIKITRDSVKGINNVAVESFDGLLVEFAKKKNINVVIRGIRTVQDFDYEFPMAQTNNVLAGGGFETIFMMTAKEFSYISSSLIREAVQFGGDISKFVPPPVNKFLMQKFGKVKR